MSKKLRVAIIFGGRSAEHEVSLQSARNIINALDITKYDPVLIGIDKTGRWLLPESSKYLVNETNPKLIALNSSNKEVVLATGRDSKQLINSIVPGESSSIDVVFPVLHGPFGEDGTIQGLLKLANLPFVGPSILGSAVSMDKDVMNRLLGAAGIPVANFLVFTRQDRINLDKVIEILGLPFFVKPANLGSSVGVSKVKDRKDFKKALETAFTYDNKILVEEEIRGREIECSVLGNEDPIASIPGEIVPHYEFYSYEAKYIDENGAEAIVPADLPKKTIKKVHELSIKTFKTLCCEGMARVDFLVTKKGEVFVNEINTIPGFTNISMYPKLWEASGVSQTKLIDRLIQLAIERFERDKKLKTTFI